MPDFGDWIGRSETREDVLDPRPARFLQATLDREPSLSEGDPLPPLWHWLYFLDARPMHTLDRDGHARRGGFLPPIPLPRRMWAGGRFEFLAPLRFGAQVRKTSTIREVSEKIGRSGRLCFVTVEHTLSVNDLSALREEHDIVYREDPLPGAQQLTPEPAPVDAEISEVVQPSPVLLFRYSALTFNGHRIHYDVDYARETEGYDGLVFHGPLAATLLADVAVRHRGETLRKFTFRGLAPITGMAPFRIEARSAGASMALWVRRQDGAMAMTARAEF